MKIPVRTLTAIIVMVSLGYFALSCENTGSVLPTSTPEAFSDDSQSTSLQNSKPAAEVNYAIGLCSVSSEFIDMHHAEIIANSVHLQSEDPAVWVPAYEINSSFRVLIANVAESYFQLQYGEPTSDPSTWRSNVEDDWYESIYEIAAALSALENGEPLLRYESTVSYFGKLCSDAGYPSVSLE